MPDIGTLVRCLALVPALLLAQPEAEQGSDASRLPPSNSQDKKLIAQLLGGQALDGRINIEAGLDACWSKSKELWAFVLARRLSKIDETWLPDERFRFLLNSAGPIEPCAQGWTETRLLACQPVFASALARLGKQDRPIDINCRWLAWLLRIGSLTVDQLSLCRVNGDRAAEVLSTLPRSSVNQAEFRHWILSKKIACENISLSTLLGELDGSEPPDLIATLASRFAIEDGSHLADLFAKLPPNFDFSQMGGTSRSRLCRSLGPTALTTITELLRDNKQLPPGVMGLVAERYVLGEGSIQRALTVANTLPDQPRYQLVTEAFRIAAKYDAFLATRSLPGPDSGEERRAAIEGIVQGINSDPERRAWQNELDHLREKTASP